MGSEFEMPESRQKESSRGKLIAIIVAFVLLFGGLVWIGVWWFTRDKDNGSVVVKGTPPEAAVKGWYDALASNQPQALWAAQPPSLKQDLVARVKKMGKAAAGKPKLYQKGMGVARNFALLIRDKKDVFLGLLDYEAKEKNPANQLGNLQSALGSLLDDNAPAGGINIPDVGEVVGNVAGNMANAQIAAMMKQYKVEPWKFDATAGILFTLLDSDIKDINWLQNPNLDNFVEKTGSGLMKQLDAIPGQEGEDSWESGFKAPLKGIQVKPISQEGDTAVVEVNYPPMAFLGTSAGVQTLKLVRVQGEWKLVQPDLIFGAMQAGIAGVDAKVKTMENYQAVAAQIGDIEGSDEESLIQGLDEVDRVIVDINKNVDTTDDFVAFLRKKFLGDLESALGGNSNPDSTKGNAANNQPVTGTIPGRPAGNTNAVARPASPNVPRGTHRGFLWLTNYNQASLNVGREIGYSIEFAFTNKPQELLIRAFGDPNEIDDRKWVYLGLRVYDMQKRTALRTVVFNVVNRRIASVICY